MENWQRLMLAEEVRKLAVALRDEEARGHQGVAARTGQQFNRLEWDAAHPLEGFIPKALSALNEVAGIVESTR